MGLLVHIADERNTARIKRSGIALGKARNVVYFMPVSENWFVSHQWLRELKRDGVRSMVGVYFRLPDDLLVWAGRYNAPHEQLPLAEAIGKLRTHPDPLGFEMFVERKVTAKEIVRVRALPQVVGWRYMPRAHGPKPCACPACIPRGSIKGRLIRERLDPMPKWPTLEEVKVLIANAVSADDLQDCLWPWRNKRRKADPSFFEKVFGFDDPLLREELATTLPYFAHQKSVEMLTRLAHDDDESVRLAAEYCLKLVLSGSSLKSLQRYQPWLADPAR